VGDCDDTMAFTILKKNFEFLSGAQVMIHQRMKHQQPTVQLWEFVEAL
jgi:hypothetical protein